MILILNLNHKQKNRLCLFLLNPQSLKCRNRKEDRGLLLNFPFLESIQLPLLLWGIPQ